MSDHIGKCSSCSAEVYWIRTAKSGKAHPCNNDFGQHSEAVFDDDGNYLRAGGIGRTSHFGTCPSREEHKTGPSKPESTRAQQWETVAGAISNTFSLGELQAMSTNLSRLVGIMDRAGANSEAVVKTRALVQGAIRKGWPQ